MRTRKGIDFMGDIGRVTQAMIRYYSGDVKRINHFLKVHGFTAAIGELEGLDERTRYILEIAALTHDIGIKVSEQKYGNSAGEHQQTEGPPEARALLGRLDIEDGVIDRVCWLIAHHHTYTDIREIDYQILVEADFLVNACEDGMGRDAIASVREKIFRTGTGVAFFDALYGE